MTRFELRKLKLVWDFAVLSSGQVAVKALAFFAFAFMARALGAVSYGRVEYVMALSSFFTMLVDGGLGPVGVRALMRDPSATRTVTANVAVARIGLALLAVPLMVIVARLSAPAAHTQMLVWLFALALAALPWRLDWLLQARERMALASMAQLLRMVVFLVPVLVLVRRPEDITLVGWAELAAATVTALYYAGVQNF